MKKLALFTLPLLMVSLMACTTATKAPKVEKKNFVPEVPKLTSDIMTPEVLWSFGRMSGAEVSPDGKSVVYAVTYFNIPENKSYRDLYSVSTDGGTPVQLTDTPEKEFNPQWRPDGKKIGYLSSKSGSVQLWEMNPDGSGQHQVSHIDGGIIGFKYAPAQDRILYIKAVKLDKSVHDLFPDLPKANARLETDLMYVHWDQWHDYTYQHVFVTDYNENNVVAGTDIMKGGRFDTPMKPFGGIEQVNFSPDGEKIAYTCKKKVGRAYALSTNSDIYLYDIANGETINYTKGMMGYDINPVFSPDGKKLAWESMERDGYESDKNRLFIADLATGDKKDYSKDFDQNVHGLVWSADSKTIYFISDIHATDEMYSLDVAADSIHRITDGVHNYQGVMTAGNKLIGQRVSMSHPADLYSVNPADGKAMQITAINKKYLDQLTFGKVEKRWVKTVDNKKELVWVIYPPHFDPNKKYPTLLYCEGGPQSTVSQFWSYRWNFQMMAANDYIIVAPNRRGLPGFGTRWNEEISGDYGGLAMDDYMSAIKAVAKEPYVDNNRLGAVGASFGGYSVYYLAGHNNGYFKAFIAHDGIFNFEAMYTTTEEIWFVNWDLGGSYWDFKNPVAMKSYARFSPHKYVQNWDAPILVIHGGKDYRIPYTQGEAAFNAARLRGIPAEFLYFPEESHWVLQAQDGILWQRVFFNWLDKYLK
ncbi:S9 family peptidase [Prolixibacter sp. SD074]|uniref:S9 family peptidase n=1 Tax=Prolixibacter sp. SD074 TaxID=2652391 RepID=UPI00126D677D|nr:S9 family peptidase [Prolixibacter sp. SD074]GET28077.1 peptidase S9 [Prolixibacter sp. SD074]